MLSKISLKNFRNLNLESIKLSPQSNVIIASNGSGKTNFIEAIFLTSFGNSFKPLESINQFIGEKGEFMKINIESSENDIFELVISREKDKLTRKLTLNTKKTTTIKILEKLPLLLFAPNSVDLVALEPSLRRDDLDNYLSMLSKEYKDKITSYQKVLKNRNVLIKMIREKKSTREELTFWTNKLADLAEYIYKARVEFFKVINEYLEKTVEKLKMVDVDSKITSLYVEYKPNLEANIESFREELIKKYIENQDKEIIVGKTLYGIHKDDFSILMNGENLRFYGSRGQQRLGILLFKLSQSDHYSSLKFSKPILLVDDLMSELDDHNRSLAATLLLQSGNQFILTSADTDEVPIKLKQTSNFIEIN